MTNEALWLAKLLNIFNILLWILSSFAVYPGLVNKMTTASKRFQIQQ